MLFTMVSHLKKLDLFIFFFGLEKKKKKTQTLMFTCGKKKNTLLNTHHYYKIIKALYTINQSPICLSYKALRTLL